MSEHSPGTDLRRSAPPLIFESGSPGRSGFFWPEEKGEGGEKIPSELLRDDIPGFPELGELEVLRHFTRLSHLNYAIESQFYPLGSCTMKYNPKVNEVVARLPGFSSLHPLAPPELIQGALELLYELEEMLAEISGMAHVTLQPAAGAQGELTGLMVIRACLRERSNPRRKIIVPDTAHGTNPASSTLCGYEVVQISSSNRGMVEAAKVAEVMDEEVAALMLTNPNTLGIFEKNIQEIAEVVHKKGGLVYLDGANLNALMGIAKPGDMGVDVLHINLHKTFSTPHGGGGPGAGPVGVKSFLRDFLPVPRILKKDGSFVLREDFAKSVGRVRSFFGNFGILVRAYAYIISLGSDGLEEASRMALLNANYLRKKLEGAYQLAYPEPCMHECVFTDRLQQRHGVATLDIAKRLLDYGFHPPTIYFPLVVSGALMIEPTETENREILDAFADAMNSIAREAKEHPDLVKGAPYTTPVGRLDEARAARKPVLRWEPAKE
ncbi:MAG: glycine dehydrogenase (aminomethyl-transferring) [Deltaproteobacteria bacterium RIFCSPLOWO2_02_56_12]|nr:MAG: glycine dehydrogenase (aminomethyl-transferring) [Deltaproteobacteria bacterium RBG_16_55_12]OGQ50213.1 MAG: glycine dehydrogenase (aminomethyl-transferring) [Deltaproteobacteria bacterium RIFCSPLOWO2_02_56_12]